MSEISQSILSGAISCDMLLPYYEPPGVGVAGHLESGFDFVSITVGTDSRSSPDLVFRRLALEIAAYDRQPDKYVVVRTADDIRRAKAERKLGVGFHFQGTEPIGRDLSLVSAYYALGVRWMLMAYNHRNNVATGCIEGETRDDGISEFGRTLISEMNRVGMIVDVSHTGYRSSMEAMELSTAPCMFSHSNPKALYDHPRNITDDQMKKAAETGGIVGINGVGSFMGISDEVTPEAVFEHIDYTVNQVGPDHVALGLDFMSEFTCDAVLAKLGGDLSKVGMLSPPWKFLHPTRLENLIECMVGAGYPTADIEKIIGGNFIRLADAVWK